MELQALLRPVPAHVRVSALGLLQGRQDRGRGLVRGVRRREREAAEEGDERLEGGEEGLGEGDELEVGACGGRARGAFGDEFCEELRELLGAGVD